jgi:uncharacterized membrane protein
MPKTYVEHHASVTINAPVQQVYSLFSHFNDFPKFMSFVKEVTYYDNQKSHWVAEVVGRHTWDAVNEGWVPNRQIGWRSTDGLDNFGKVTFTPTDNNGTGIDVVISYDPPAGVLGDAGEKLGAGHRFERALQNDLDHFARLVEAAPAGALDATSSNYLFHADSAASRGTTTTRQNETMYDDASGSDRRPVNPPMNDAPTSRTDKDLAEHDIDTGAIPIENSETARTVPDYPTTERGNLS